MEPSMKAHDMDDLVRQRELVPELAAPDSRSTPTEAETAPANLKIPPHAAQDSGQAALGPKSPLFQKRPLARELLLASARKLVTVFIALAAVMISLIAWDHYLTAPWTRDGSVRVQVASVAPEISGRIRELRVVDNQFVHKGD